ncbi:uncharacterized protein LOC142523283 isoform X2 [Primulina tabacum]|uniref:uncharacterized protein LOC142523283 isoform X2 n=1 Tax=Primulina tabacum TaxID=48773 RepID=UPI003F5A5A88
MPSGPKKRKAARKKETLGNTQSCIEDSSSKLESINENTTMPAVDDGLDSNKENSSLSVVEETDELVGNDHGEVLNSDKENPVVEAGMGLSCVDDSVVVVQEYDQALLQNMHAHQISEQLEGLKKMVFEVLCEVDKTRTTLHELLDGFTKIQQIIVEQ